MMHKDGLAAWGFGGFCSCFKHRQIKHSTGSTVGQSAVLVCQSHSSPRLSGRNSSSGLISACQLQRSLRLPQAAQVRPQHGARLVAGGLSSKQQAPKGLGQRACRDVGR